MNATGSDRNQLTATVREEFGKGAARRLRAAGQIPAVLYGHGSDPRHLALPAHDTFLMVRQSNAVLELDVAGEEQLALVKDVQRNPIMNGAEAIEHIDLIIVRRGEKVTVDVPVVLEGESAEGTISNLESTTLSIEVEALKIPESITVSIEGLEEGAQILASDVELPSGAELLTDPESLVVGIIVPQLDLETTAETEGDEGEEAEGDAAEGAAEDAGDAEAAEGEGE